MRKPEARTLLLVAALLAATAAVASAIGTGDHGLIGMLAWLPAVFVAIFAARAEGEPCSLPGLRRRRSSRPGE